MLKHSTRSKVRRQGWRARSRLSYVSCPQAHPCCSPAPLPFICAGLALLRRQQARVGASAAAAATDADDPLAAEERRLLAEAQHCLQRVAEAVPPKVGG